MSNDKMIVSAEDEELIREQMATVIDEDFSAFSMQVIEIPKAPAKVFDTGDKIISGTIICWQPVRAYYATEFTGGNEPPDCSSQDGKTGDGTPGGDCKTCPFSQWGSGGNGGQACAQRMHVVFLMDGEELPHLLNLPPSSLKAFKDYGWAMSSKKLPIIYVKTELSLVMLENKGGIKYNQLIFTKTAALSEEERENIKAMKAQFAPMLAARPAVEPNMDVDKYAD